MAEKIITVVGATGSQGGGLVRAILSDSARPFDVRAVTRHAGSDKARELERLGAQVVEANLDEPASVSRAFRGAYGAYCVTNYWEHFSSEKKIAQAANMAQATKNECLQHVVWSTFEGTRKWVPLDDDRMPTLMGKYRVPHFDAKGEANREFTERGVPTTLLLTSFYWDNFIHFGMGPKPDADGAFVITFRLVDKKLPGIAVEDIGKCAYGIFGRGGEYVGKTVGVAGGHLTGADMAAALTAALGQPVRYNDVAPETYRRFGFPGAEDLGNMFQFKRDFNDYYCGARDIARTRMLNPSLQSFEQWLARNKDRIPLQQ